MPVIHDRQALAARRQAAQAKRQAINRSKTLVNVSCGTCGIASGAEKILKVMQEEAKTLKIEDIEFIRSGCMTYCFAEPTVTITLSDSEPITFGKVDEERARALMGEYILKGLPVPGEIPNAYERVMLSD